MPHIESGMIVLWSGAVIDIPSGWSLCDGTLGTPDLRDNFVIGAGSTFNPDDTGGALTHDHTFTGDGHSHTLPAGVGVGSGAQLSPTTSSNPATGTTDSGSSLPPFYSLAYIIFL